MGFQLMWAKQTTKLRTHDDGHITHDVDSQAKTRPPRGALRDHLETRIPHELSGNPSPDTHRYGRHPLQEYRVLLRRCTRLFQCFLAAVGKPIYRLRVTLCANERAKHAPDEISNRGTAERKRIHRKCTNKKGERCNPSRSINIRSDQRCERHQKTGAGQLTSRRRVGRI